MDLFDAVGTDEAGLPVDTHAPLAVRMRPRSLEEVLGQDHLLAPASTQSRLVEAPLLSGRGADGVSTDRKSTRLNTSHFRSSRMPSSA